MLISHYLIGNAYMSLFYMSYIYFNFITTMGGFEYHENAMLIKMKDLYHVAFVLFYIT